MSCMLDTCCSIIRGQLEGKDVELKTDFTNIQHDGVIGNKLHIRQILLNILSNAVKYTDNGYIYFKCDEISFLIYGEGCLKAKSLKAYLRAGVFCADSWDDRIYAYERDIPGTFNVPAFYGRGLWASFTGNWRFAPWGRVYARASLTEYFQTEKKKPGKAELKLMLKIDI